MLPAADQRVESHTCEAIDRQIARQAGERIAHYSTKSPQEISERIRELDHERGVRGATLHPRWHSR